MTDQNLQIQTQRALLMFIALVRVQNESYTHFIGHFKHEQKSLFNQLINLSNNFIKESEKKLSLEEINATKQLEEYFQDFTFGLIKGGEFDLSKKSVTINYLKELNADNNYHINEVLKMLNNEN